MNQSMPPAPAPMMEQPKKSNTWLIVVIVLIVLCCICAIVAAGLYQYGDQIMRALGLQ